VTAFLSFLLADLLVLVGAMAATSALAVRGALDRTLAASTIAISQVVVSMLIAGGLLQELNRGAVLLANAAITVLLIGVATWRNGGRLPLPRPPAISAVPAALGRVPALMRAHPWCSLIVGLAGAEFLWRALLVYLLPPYAYDALWYHLTSVGAWLQDGAIGHVPFDFRSSNFPANGELTFAWVALFLRSDTWINGVQLAFAVVGSLAVGGIARTVGLTRAGATAAGALFFLTPAVLAQATTDYVDVIFTATFLLSLHFLFRYMAGLPRGDLSARTRLVEVEPPIGAASALLLAGLAAGLAFGAKRTGIVYCGVAVVALAVNLGLRRRAGSISWRRVMVRLAVFLIPLLLVGSYWYARNWVEDGNPAYPAAVTVLGQTIFEGPKSAGEVYGGEAAPHPWYVQVPLSWLHDAAPWAHPHDDYYAADQRSGGLGPPYVYLEVPALVALAVVSLRRDRRLLNLLVPVAVMFVLQPDKWWARYTLVVAGVGAVALVYVTERWAKRPAGLAARVLTPPLIVLGLWFATWGLALGGGFENVGPRLWAPDVAKLIRHPADRNIDRVLELPPYGFLANVPSGSGVGVAVGATPFYSPFYGSHYQNRVYALRASDASDLRSIVARDRMDYLFLPRRGALTSAARKELGRLHTIFDDAYVRVYELG
jgi:hypothetical protein